MYRFVGLSFWWFVGLLVSWFMVALRSWFVGLLFVGCSSWSLFIVTPHGYYSLLVALQGCS
jgi:hypothetical protein